MGNTLMQIGTGFILEAGTTGESNAQFPFLAALILVAIVVVVMISDAKIAKKRANEDNTEKDDEIPKM